MIGPTVSWSRILHIAPAADVPGLFDVLLEDGTWICDLTTRQTDSLVRRNGTVPKADRLALIEGRG